MLMVGRLSENLALAFGDRVAADDQAAIDAVGDVAGFLRGQAGDQCGRRFGLFGICGIGFSGFARRDNGETVASFRQELPSPGRTAGQYQWNVIHTRSERPFPSLTLRVSVA